MFLTQWAANPVGDWTARAVGRARRQAVRRSVYRESIGQGAAGPVAVIAAARADAVSPAVRRARAGRVPVALWRWVDRVIARFSLVPDDAVLDVRGFGWTARLRDQWRAIRDEADRLESPRHMVTELWRDGVPVAGASHACPATLAALAGVPGLEQAGFVALAGGAHLPVRRGATRALLTCHLGLIVPRDGDVRMRVGDRVLRWAEGETLVFDDSRGHSLSNDSSGARVVLALRFRRPLRQPGRWIGERLVRGLRGSPGS